MDLFKDLFECALKHDDNNNSICGLYEVKEVTKEMLDDLRNLHLYAYKCNLKEILVNELNENNNGFI